MGVQNYGRTRWAAHGRLPSRATGTRNWLGDEVYALSLAGAVKYAHVATGRPILGTEHGVTTEDDTIRAALVPAALVELKRAIADGVPVHGYMHWSLMDDFEWVWGCKPEYGWRRSIASPSRAP